MKSILFLVATSCLLLIPAVTARAQVVDTVVADIPFGFTVRNTTLPAGHYTITRFGANPQAMEIVGGDPRRPIVFLVNSAQVLDGPKNTEVVFDRVGDQYFLSMVFEAGDTIGVEIPKSHAERRMEKEGAMVQVNSISIDGTQPGL